jgi:hypothetical protein
MHPVATQGKEFKRRQAEFMTGLEKRLSERERLGVEQLRQAFPRKLPSTDQRPLVPRRRP